MTELSVDPTASADIKFLVDLDAVTTTIRLVYNTRVGYWFIELDTENDFLSGVKCVLDYPLIYPHRALFNPLPGDFMIMQTTNLTEEIDFTYDLFGSVFRLFYLTAAEVDAWESENGL